MRRLSAAILLVDILARYHSTSHTSFVSDVQFRRNLRSSGDDLYELWVTRGNVNRPWGRHIGLIDIVGEMCREVRRLIPGPVNVSRIFTAGDRNYISVLF